MITRLFDPNRPSVTLGYRIDHEPAGTAHVMTGGGQVQVSGDLQPVHPAPVVAQLPRPRWMDDSHQGRRNW